MCPAFTLVMKAQDSVTNGADVQTAEGKRLKSILRVVAMPNG
jgi:hypothetical protein